MNGNSGHLVVQTAHSPPCRTWRCHFSWTDSYSTSWACAHLIGGGARGCRHNGSIPDRRPSPRLLHIDTRFSEQDSRTLVRRSRTRYVLSFAEYSLRNLATFGATTAVQYPWNGFREKYS